MSPKPHSDARPAPRVVIAGATGSIGTALCRDLCDDYHVVVLTHLRETVDRPDIDLRVEWRVCDWFSRTDFESAMEGADYGFFLVHTRLPSARLDQAQCDDMDVLVADNFARAAGRCGVRQILCLRNMMRREHMPEAVWQRRNEIPETLAAYGTPVTVLRASLIVAPGSTAVNLIAGLVRRAPVLLVPPWAMRPTQPIAIQDVLRAFRYCLGRPATFDRQFDIGGPAVTDLARVMTSAAEALGRRPRVVRLRWLPPWLFSLLLRLTSPATHPALIRLMLKDLRYEAVAVAADNPVQRAIEPGSRSALSALDPYLRGPSTALPENPRRAMLGRYRAKLRQSRQVRSIQRLRLPPGRDARWVARRYFHWLPRFVGPLVRCDIDADGSYRVRLRWPRVALLTLSFQPAHSDSNRRMYFITGGLLASGSRNVRGRMEFRDVLGGRYTIVAIHEFAPSLPWNFYHATQAMAHGLVMRAFQRYMARRAARG
jgi:uncharacterized protein YbjT (DUF2867 family)